MTDLRIRRKPAKSNDYKLLIDGDMLLYRASWATAKCPYADAVTSLFVMMHGLFERLDSDDYIFFLSSKENFRKHTYPLYKYNRYGRTPPPHVDKLRKFAIRTLRTRQMFGYEADDLIADAMGEGRIIVSLDKDFDQLVGFHYRWTGKEKGLYWVGEERATRFSYEQFLSGDRIDNIPGLSERAPKRGIGAKRATALLASAENKEEMLTIVKEMYEKKYGDDYPAVLSLNMFLLTLGTHKARQDLEVLVDHLI